MNFEEKWSEQGKHFDWPLCASLYRIKSHARVLWGRPSWGHQEAGVDILACASGKQSFMVDGERRDRRREGGVEEPESQERVSVQMLL